MTDKVHFSSDKQDWETPDDLFQALHAIFKFDVDVCAHEQNAKLPVYFDETDDALSIENWFSTVLERGRWRKLSAWANPPYSRASKVLQSWVEKCVEQSQRSCGVVMLLPARTETKWFQPLWEADALIFVRGRLKFVGGKGSAPFPSVIAVFNHRLSRRDRVELEKIGKVIIP
jgi:phage N-6-adenine-methyltransferase